jgi:hypothetical protein
MSIQCNVFYTGDADIFVRFASHFELGISKDVGNHEKNLLERMGDFGLSIVEKLPVKVWDVLKDPRIVTIALTSFAMLAASFLFYPSLTYQNIKAIVELLPPIPFWAIRFSAYIFTIGTILAAGLRAGGRFSNTTLMNAFYTQRAPEPVQVQPQAL